MPNSQAVKAMVFDTVIVGSNPTWAATGQDGPEIRLGTGWGVTQRTTTPGNTQP